MSWFKFLNSYFAETNTTAGNTYYKEAIWFKIQVYSTTEVHQKTFNFFRYKIFIFYLQTRSNINVKIKAYIILFKTFN